MAELFSAVLVGALCVLVAWAALIALARLQPACASLMLSALTQKLILLLGCFVMVVAFGWLAATPQPSPPVGAEIRQVDPTSSAVDAPTPVTVLVSQSTHVQPLSVVPQVVRPAALAIDLHVFPRPPGDNGRGLHWFPTTAQAKAVVDTFVPELVAMHIKWVPFVQGLEDYDLAANDYLVQRLIQSQLMPVMRVEVRIGALDEARFRRVIEHYTTLGVRYIQVYNEPNLREEWSDGKIEAPAQFAALWLEAADVVVAAKAFPGLAALSPSGEMSDTDYLRAALEALNQTRRYDVLARTWLAVHNYTLGQSGDVVQDDSGYGRYRRYASISQAVLETTLPIIGTEGGVPGADAQLQARALRAVFQSLPQREPFWFAYSPWLIGNAVGGGTDMRWERAAWFKTDRDEPIVQQLKAMH